MNDIEIINSRLEKLEKRNKRVELDKMWETSLTRRILLAAFTYLAVSLYLLAINVENPWLNAIVPTVGFLLSTLTMPFFKKNWIKRLIEK